jgi:hypothetical protein
MGRLLVGILLALIYLSADLQFSTSAKPSKSKFVIAPRPGDDGFTDVISPSLLNLDADV